MNLKRSSYRSGITSLEFVIDMGGVVLSFFLAHLIYTHYFFHPNLPSFEEKSPLIAFVALLSVALFFANDLYRKHHTILNIEETRIILKSFLLSAIFTFALFELLRGIRQPRILDAYPLLSHWHSILSSHDFPNMFSRIELTLAFSFMFPLVSFFRYTLYKFQQSLHLKGIGRERVAVYGEGSLAERLIRKIQRSPKSGYFFVGSIGSTKSEKGVDNYLGSFAELESMRNTHQIDRVLIADETLSSESMVHMLRQAEKLGVHLEFVPALHSLFVHRILLKDIDGLPIISVKNMGSSWFQRFLKRSFDLFFGLFFLILASPLFFLASIWIFFSFSGSVFFSQTRVGRKGKKFQMYKFRTMREDVEVYANTPDSSQDDRITPPGKWLRRFSLDELPQLFNVLKGEMSLVGPRPEMPFIVEKYNALENERLRIKPGITGLWQISSDRKLQIHENLDYDLYYIEHQGLLLDFVILLRTFYSVVRGIGAY